MWTCVAWRNSDMLHVLRRHPFPVSAYFRHSLVLTYAYPEDLLRPLLPPGLVLDTLRGFGFLTVALVQTEQLRPDWLPKVLARDVFLGGYRLFVRRSGYPTHRGLRILRSLTDGRWMYCAGTLFTRYRYGLCRANLEVAADRLEWRVDSPTASLDVAA